MKRILSLVVLLLVSYVGFAQAPSNYTNINGRYRWIAGMFDSTFSLPKGTTPSLRTGGSTNPGAVFYRTTDSSLYIYTGNQWLKQAGASGFVPYTGATQNLNLGQKGLYTEFVTFDTTAVADSVRKLKWNNDFGTLDLGMGTSGVVQQIGLENYIYVHNSTGQVLTDGTVVYMEGATGNHVSVQLADNRYDSTALRTIGVVTQTIGIGELGYVTTFGAVNNLNLSMFNEGDIIYLDTSGNITNVEPIQPKHNVQVGIVARANAGNGILQVSVKTGLNLVQLDDVKAYSPVNNSVLAYNTSQGLWIDTTLAGVGGVTGSLVSGYLTKATGTSTIDTSQLYQSSGLIGIGTTSPTQKLDVRGRIAVNTSGQSFTINNYYPSGGQGNNIFIGNGGQNGVYSSGFNAAWNTSLGINAFLSSTTGFQNTAIGYRSLETSTTGNNNVAVGASSMLFNTSGTQNVAVGTLALSTNTTGQNNTAVGQQAGASRNNGAGENSTSTNSVYLGYYTSSSANGNTNEIVIGSQAEGNGSNSVTLGNTSITKTVLRENVGVGTTAPDSALTVQNGTHLKRGVRMSGLPAAPGTKALRIDANGTISTSDTLIDAGGTVTSVATNTGTGITGGTITTSGTLAIDTLLISTRAWRQKGVDSVAGLLSGYVPTSRTLTINGTSYDLSANRSWSVGTVTSVATNTATGITGGTITGSGTLAIDTLLVSTRAWRQKGIDSVAALLPAAISGTTNYIPKFTSSSAIGNSIIYESGGNIGIGTISPTNARLEISADAGAGALSFRGRSSDNTSSQYFYSNDGATLYSYLSANASNFDIRAYASIPMIFYTANSERMRLDASGNLGIGTSSPAASLHVAGTIASTPTGSGVLMGLQGNYAVTHLNGSDGGLIDFSVSGTDTRGRILYTNSTNAMTFGTTDGTTDMTLDASGNLGLGVSPSAWGSARAFDMSGGVGIASINNESYYVNNGYYNGGWIYKASSYATMYVQNSTGQFQWHTAPSGTAGNAISFTQAMTLDASGRLGIGTTSPNYLLHIGAGAVNAQLQFTTTGTGTTTSDGFHLGVNNSTLNAFILQKENADLQFLTNDTERMRITSGGELLINTTSDAGDYKLQVNGNGYFNGNIYTTSNLDLSGDIRYQSNAGFGIKSQDGGRLIEIYNGQMTLNGNFVGTGSIKTAAPSGGTAKPYKWGEAGVAIGGSDGYAVKVEIDGTLYYLMTGYLPEPAPEATSGPSMGYKTMFEQPTIKIKTESQEIKDLKKEIEELKQLIKNK